MCVYPLNFSFTLRHYEPGLWDPVHHRPQRRGRAQRSVNSAIWPWHLHICCKLMIAMKSSRARFDCVVLGCVVNDVCGGWMHVRHVYIESLFVVVNTRTIIMRIVIAQPPVVQCPSSRYIDNSKRTQTQTQTVDTNENPILIVPSPSARKCTHMCNVRFRRASVVWMCNNPCTSSSSTWTQRRMY